jgi:hypothetical protein
MAKTNKTNWMNVSILVVSVVVGSLAVYWTSKEGGSIVAPSQYVSSDNGIAFDYPSSLIPVDEDISMSVHVVNLYTKGKENTSNEIISITDMTVDSDQAIVESAADYLEVDQEKIIETAYKDGAERARYIAYSPSGEVAYYNFFKDGARLDVLKFNQKLFDKSNPLVIRNNSYYNFAYTTILNSLSLTSEQ